MEIAFKRCAAAAALFLTLLASPGHSEDAFDLLARGTQALNAGDQQAALEILTSIPAPAPDEDGMAFVQGRMQAARIHYASADYRAVERVCGEILKIYPDNLEAMNLTKQAADALTPRWLKFARDLKTYLPALIKATGMTLLLVIITMLISPVAGMLVALGRISRIRPLKALTWFYIWIFRGTPLLLQLFFIYYGLPQLGCTLKPFTAAIIGLGLNYSAYLAEIMRGAIESIDPGQMEAAKSIGMTYRQAMRRIIIPQTYKRLVPPVGNEFIALIKDTALVSTIAMVELMRTADQIFNATFNIFILAQAAIIYLLMTSLFTLAFHKLEERLGVYENR
jgi:polar amino acid transport system permease protein